MEYADASEHETMYRWFESHIGGVFPDFAEDVLEEVLLQFFDEPEYLKNSLIYTNGRLQSADSYQIPYYAQRALEIMEKLHYPESDVREFRLQYRYLPHIREIEIDDAISRKQYGNALALLNESKELDKDNPCLVRGYDEKIIEICEITEQKEKLTSALLNYISLFPQYDLEFIRKYKACISPGKWEDELRKLLSLPTVKPVRCQLLFEEEKNRELFDEVKRFNSLNAFCRYESVFRKLCPDEALLYYAELLSEGMAAASSRNQYREIVRHFKGLLNYPDGRERILLLSEQWMSKYPRRRAMLEEIADELKRRKIKQ